LRHAHPVWVLRAFRRALAAEGRADELTALLEADNAAPGVTLAALPGVAEPPEHSHRTRYSPIGFALDAGDPEPVIASADGAIRVQDEGSQLAALALSRWAPVRPGEAWLDLCAGPGGKTAVLATAAQRTGATLRANEVAPHRAELVRSAVKESGAPATVVAHDGREAFAYEDAAYDRIMIDAPCSGLGALRRSPEARRRKRPDDVKELTRLQPELLEAASQPLAPGGIIAYVTCSPHLAETRGGLEAHLAAHEELSELDTQAVVNSISRTPITQGRGDCLSVQLWPDRDGTDA